MKPIRKTTVHTVLTNLNAQRNEKGISCKNVAEKLGISVQTYRRMEAGTQTISLDQFFHLADILGVPIIHLMAAEKIEKNTRLLRRAS